MSLWLKLAFFPLRLLFKPVTSILKTTKMLYWAAGLLAITGFLGGIWLRDINLFGTMFVLLVIWSVTFSFVYR